MHCWMLSWFLYASASDRVRVILRHELKPELTRTNHGYHFRAVFPEIEVNLSSEK
jgi:hypothetical protein